MVRRTINVSIKTYEKLKSKGIMGETFDDVINRLMFEEGKKATASKSKVADKI